MADQLNNKVLHNLYSSPDVIRVMKSKKMGGTCSAYGRDEKSIHILTQKI
jgi:hypothetical protein